ncbi:unnamed protein product [Rotaria magnacalcarata]|uniref:RNA-dependent RNA polymerase n=1 Tax=Rotaria magnacalcarata TaxID=392030 RepID=A0A816VH47_9BILA|nr:unnamed protein product [Rotaria magnacalcarata]CAF2120064.1 unnamed protein product [Rotaria magnacalcarata]
MSNRKPIKTTDDNKISNACVIHITPTRFLIMSKEEKERTSCYELFGINGINDFCLVYLKPDSPNIYFNDDNNHLIDYFKDMFHSGIDFGGNHCHLFGASNSQLKDHSFWFIKGLTLHEIHQRQQLLSQSDQILNLGTYFARLGLWFSKTDSINIKLHYC